METNENTLGGSLWVNLLNTKRFVGGEVIDILDHQDLFIAWLDENDMSLSGDRTVDESQIEKLRVLRGNFNAIMREFTEGIPLGEMESLRNINKALESIPATLNATFGENETTIDFHACDHRDELALQVINSFLTTCKSYGLERVRQCAHEECILYFLDLSKSGKRKWCSMETCGNRKKAAKHYHKVKSPK
jgi:predicted RNA-binding Zn ribbon-like protein